ncbi:MAG: rhodanese-like domain-containing protein [Pseudomonadota bacterium]
MLISAQELEKVDGVILDIRTKAEHDNLHLVDDHTFMPMDEIELSEFVPKQDKPLFILCHSGGRAMQLAELLIQSGLPDTKVVQGGIRACQTCMPVLGTDIMEDQEIHAFAHQSFQLFMHRNRSA